MKALLSFTLALVGLIGLAGAQAAEIATEQEPMFRHPDVETAWEAAHESGRPLFVFVTRDDCAYCEKMMAETLSHPKLAPVIREQFETVQFSAELRPDLIKHFAVRLCPTVLIISPEGEFLVRVDGFADPKKFVSTFRPAMVKYAQSKKALAQHEARPIH